MKKGTLEHYQDLLLDKYEIASKEVNQSPWFYSIIAVTIVLQILVDIGARRIEEFRKYIDLYKPNIDFFGIDFILQHALLIGFAVFVGVLLGSLEDGPGLTKF